MNQLALELDINSAVDNIRDVVLELLNCERVTLFLVDNRLKELRQVSTGLNNLHCCITEAGQCMHAGNLNGHIQAHLSSGQTYSILNKRPAAHSLVVCLASWPLTLHQAQSTQMPS